MDDEIIDDGNEFAGSESPIDQCDVSVFTTQQLSLPESFDDSLCLDLYKEFKTKPAKAVGTTGNIDERVECNHDLESKVRELQSKNLQLKEKGRLYDSLKKQSDDTKCELEEMREQLQNQASLYDNSIVREKELQHQILEYKRKVHLMGMDLEHSRNESEVFLSRAEKAERDHQTAASEMRISQQKHEKAISRLTAEREAAKSESEREVARIKEESSNEIRDSRTHQSDAFARESKLLCDARDNAIEQAKLLKQELREVRAEKEAKEGESLQVIQELERQLSDARSDLKVRACERNTIQLCQDRTTAEARRLKEENETNKQSLAKLEKECARLEEAVRNKDAALEVYHHDDLLVGCDAANLDSNAIGPASERKSLIRNSVALARKCRELQVQLKRQSDELAAERKNLAKLRAKEDSNQRLFKELTLQNNKAASSYIVAAVNARDNEISRLEKSLSKLRSDYRDVVEERDAMKASLAEMLKRREQLDEMKGLVDKMRHVNFSDPNHSPHRDNQYGDGELLDNDDDHDNLSDHLVHHRTAS